MKHSTATLIAMVRRADDWELFGVAEEYLDKISKNHSKEENDLIWREVEIQRDFLLHELSR